MKLLLNIPFYPITSYNCYGKKQPQKPVVSDIDCWYVAPHNRVVLVPEGVEHMKKLKMKQSKVFSWFFLLVGVLPLLANAGEREVPVEYIAGPVIIHLADAARKIETDVCFARVKYESKDTGVVACSIVGAKEDLHCPNLETCIAPKDPAEHRGLTAPMDPQAKESSDVVSIRDRDWEFATKPIKSTVQTGNGRVTFCSGNIRPTNRKNDENEILVCRGVSREVDGKKAMYCPKVKECYEDLKITPAKPKKVGDRDMSSAFPGHKLGRSGDDAYARSNSQTSDSHF